jgi:hypothetical protein
MPPQSPQSHTTISTAYAPSPRVRALGAFIKSRWWAVLPSILAGGGSLISPMSLIGDPFPRWPSFLRRQMLAMADGTTPAARQILEEEAP